MENIIIYLVGGIASLLGLLWWQNNKLNSAKGMLENLEVKEELLEKDKERAVLEAQVEALKKFTNVKELTDEELANIFNINKPKL